MAKKISLGVILAGALLATGCTQDLLLTADNNSTNNVMNVFVINVDDGTPYTSFQAITPGNSSAGSVRLANRQGAVAEVRIVADLKTPGNNVAALLDEVIPVDPELTSVRVEATSDTTLELTIE